MELPLPLDEHSPVPLHRQLYEGLRQAVLSGRLAPGARLPATRTLAATLAVSRTTVTVAYDQLLAEGYVEARTGAGTYVSAELPEALLRSPGVRAPEARPAFFLPLSAYGARLGEAGPLRGATSRAPIAFGHYGRPALDAFPIDTWRRLMLRHARSGHAPLDYAEDALGHRPLREAIAAHLNRSRAMRCTADQVAVVSGSQQALDLIARLIVDPGEAVALEDPGYLGARNAFAAQGARLVPIPVDESGMRVDQLPDDVQLVHVTPSHQFPTGAVLSLPRRLALLEWAREHSAWIVEDDYDSEYRYGAAEGTPGGSRPIPALQGLDSAGVVLYVGTFSKVLFPALRLGYMVVPPSFVPYVARAKWLADRASPMLEQLTLTDFIVEGHLERHLRRMRALYASRREALIAALETHLGDRVTILGDHAGIHLTIRLDTPLNDAELLARAEAHGVGLSSTRVCYMGDVPHAELVLGYGDMDEQAIAEGVRRLAAAIRA